MTAVERHLSHPENRIRYCLTAMEWWPEEDLKAKAFKSFLYWVDQAEDEEAHF